MGGLGRVAARLGDGLRLCAVLGLCACARDAPPPAGEAPVRLTPIVLAPEPRSPAVRPEIFGDGGQLLASEQRAAGIVLPRGLIETHRLDHQRHYRSRASIAQLRQYFGRRLVTGKIERGGMGSITYVEAQPTETDKRAFVTVRIGPAPGNRAQSEVLIRETPMMPVAYPSAAEARKRLMDLRKYAD